MPHTVTETDDFSASVTVPNPGELVAAADLENAVQPLANRTKHLYSGDTVFTGEKTFNGGGTINGPAWDVNALWQLTGGVLVSGGFQMGPLILPDTNATIHAGPTNTPFRYVPRVLTNNTIYTLADFSLPLPNGAGVWLFVSRMPDPGPVNPNNKTVTFKREGAPSADILSFPASQPAWAVFAYGSFGAAANTWYVLFASANCTYL